MMDYVSLSLAILGIILAYYFYRKTKVVRKIGYEVLNLIDVFKVNTTVPELRITYRNVDINKLFTSEVRLSNQGNQDIQIDRQNLWDESNEKVFPVKLSSNGASIVDVLILEKSEGFDVEVDNSNLSNGEIGMSFDLMKKEDYFLLKITSLDSPVFSMGKTRLPRIDLGEVKNAKIKQKSFMNIGFLLALISIMLSTSLAFLVKDSELLNRGQQVILTCDTKEIKVGVDISESRAQINIKNRLGDVLTEVVVVAEEKDNVSGRVISKKEKDVPLLRSGAEATLYFFPTTNSFITYIVKYTHKGRLFSKNLDCFK